MPSSQRRCRRNVARKDYDDAEPYLPKIYSTIGTGYNRPKEWQPVPQRSLGVKVTRPDLGRNFHNLNLRLSRTNRRRQEKQHEHENDLITVGVSLLCATEDVHLTMARLFRLFHIADKTWPGERSVSVANEVDFLSLRGAVEQNLVVLRFIRARHALANHGSRPPLPSTTPTNRD